MRIGLLQVIQHHVHLVCTYLFLLPSFSLHAAPGLVAISRVPVGPFVDIETTYFAPLSHRNTLLNANVARTAAGMLPISPVHDHMLWVFALEAPLWDGMRAAWPAVYQTRVVVYGGVVLSSVYTRQTASASIY